jgi:NADH-quinone oxidoreductase subunit L
MGALSGKMRITFVTFLIGTLALIGFPGSSGFFSKDAILAVAHAKSAPLFWIALFTAFLTAFYMLRLVLVVFFGKSRSEHAAHGKESPIVMTGPLLILAVPALIAGFGFFAHHFLPVPHADDPHHVVPMFATGAMLLGVVAAFMLYRNREHDPINLAIFRRRFYFDELYAWLIRSTQELLASISAFIDRWIIDVGGVRGASGATWGFGSLLRLVQVGNLQAYAFIFGLGIVGLIYFTVFR